MIVRERAVRGAEHDDGAVDVARLGDVGRDEGGADRVHLDDLAEQEAGHVEVVDRHVAEQAAGRREVARGRRLGVAAGDRDLLQPADVARPDPVVDLPERRVEAPVESHHHDGVERRDRRPAFVDPRDVEVDRLLAQHGLARL